MAITKLGQEYLLQKISSTVDLQYNVFNNNKVVAIHGVMMEDLEPHNRQALADWYKDLIESDDVSIMKDPVTHRFYMGPTAIVQPNILVPDNSVTGGDTAPLATHELVHANSGPSSDHQGAQVNVSSISAGAVGTSDLAVNGTMSFKGASVANGGMATNTINAIAYPYAMVNTELLTATPRYDGFGNILVPPNIIADSTNTPGSPAHYYMIINGQPSQILTLDRARDVAAVNRFIAARDANHVSPPRATRCSRNNGIRRPPNAYILYRRDWHAHVKASNPGIHNNNISVILGKQWQEESVETRARYKAMADELKRQHLEKYPNYRYSPRRSAEIQRRATTGANH